jgi:MGT family glycosyltransferase
LLRASRSDARRRATILFFPESAYGPTNNCIGIGERLLRAGHRVVFAAERSWEGRLSPYGFEEALVDLSEPAGDESVTDPGAFWKEFIRSTAPQLRLDPVEQFEAFMVPTWQALVDGAQFCEPSLRKICDEMSPDVVVEDNVVCFPALLTCGAPFVRIVSCNPLEIRGSGLPPPYAGLPAKDSSRWEEAAAEYDRTHRPLWEDFNSWVQEQGAPALPDLEFMPTSSWLNLYVYPEIIDYTASRPLGENFARLASSVRATDPPIELSDLPMRGQPEGRLVYLSLGSLGGADVSLMRRLVGFLADSPHRFIVSKGPQASEYELPENMWGAEFLPQTRILPEVDLVITHGGNNTVTESMHFGKPMVVLPLFWDQHDNAQRVAETGFGLRLRPYDADAGELNGAVERLLDDEALRRRLEKESEAIRAADGVGRAAARIAALAERGS